MTTEFSIENSQAQMRKGTIEFAALLVIAQGDAYTSDIIRRLKEADLIVVEGTLYPLLNRLRKNNLVDYEWKESPLGPPRKYYQLTNKGEAALQQLRTTWNTLDKTISSLITSYEKST